MRVGISMAMRKKCDMEVISLISEWLLLLDLRSIATFAMAHLKRSKMCAEDALERSSVTTNAPLLSQLKGNMKITKEIVLLWAETQLWKAAPLNNAELQDIQAKIMKTLCYVM